ncbi:recombination regulator RecX [Bacillus dakarensis]|uniref:recombination regulator RecX n=1 Tax=Robertmurraya dakarensis TaxID=1926278 RepID=UPI0009821458|nr:recombination regulator RecX [Bacillus dakarensis]
MTVITKITTQKKNKDRYNIFMDYGNGEEYAFSVDGDVLVKFQLKKGMELDDLSLTEIHYQDDVRKAYHMAIRFLSRKMRSETEVKRYLAEKEVDVPIIQEVVHKLNDYQFLNDEEYAYAYVRTQMNTTDKGIDLIRRELLELGIHEDLISASLNEYPYDMQVEKAVELCGKFTKKHSKDSQRILKQKTEQHLIRKGFPLDIISAALEKFNNNHHHAEELDALKFQAEKANRKYAGLSSYEYKQKMKQFLFRKGFSIESIEEFLNTQNDA